MNCRAHPSPHSGTPGPNHHSPNTGQRPPHTHTPPGSGDAHSKTDTNPDAGMHSPWPKTCRGATRVGAPKPSSDQALPPLPKECPANTSILRPAKRSLSLATTAPAGAHSTCAWKPADYNPQKPLRRSSWEAVSRESVPRWGHAQASRVPKTIITTIAIAVK